jgi:cysteine dioxygenase
MDKLFDYFSNLNDINLKEHVDANELKLCNLKEECKSFIKFSDEKYNRIRLDNYCTDKFEFIIICWNKGQESQIHDHPENGCILKILSGKILEEVYDDNLNLIKNNYLTKDDISYREKDKITHKIIPLEESISLHIYSAPNYTPNILKL